jgi:hypothetical protein
LATRPPYGEVKLDMTARVSIRTAGLDGSRKRIRDRSPIGLADVSPDDDHAILPRAEVAAVHQAGRASWQISMDQRQPLASKQPPAVIPLAC